MPPKTKLSIELRIFEFFKQYPVSDSTLLVAVSGGQDSVCLLHLLSGLRTELNLKIHVAHLNHQLRAKESDLDAQYVFDLCHKLELPVTIGQADTNAYQTAHKLSLEEAAREVRYQFLAETADSIKTKNIAVAHTRDDNVETILLHIMRGSGIRGLIGLTPVSQRLIDGKKMSIFRPLLNITHKETGVYCRIHKLNPRLDATNLTLEPLRNRVRLELLPALKTFNPGIDAALLRTSLIAADDMDLLESLAQKSWRRVVSQQDDGIFFEREKMQVLHVGLQRSLLRMAVGKLAGTLKDIETRHIEEILSLIQKPAGKSLDLPYGLIFKTDYRHFILAKKDQEGNKLPSLIGVYDIKLPGLTEIPGWRITSSYIKPTGIQLRDVFTVRLDADLTGEKLTVRSRRPGDRFQPLGMRKMKKVGDFMLDAHVPLGSRSRVPVVLSKNQLLWLVGWRIDDRVKVTLQTRRVLKLVFRKK